MPLQAHPWFRRSDGWWYVKIDGKQQKLAQGRDNKEAAIHRWHEFMTERASNPASDSRDHTIASVIDLHLVHAQRSLAEESAAAASAAQQITKQFCWSDWAWSFPSKSQVETKCSEDFQPQTS